MTLELWGLVGAIVLGIVHISADSFSFKAQVGNAYTIGARDEPVEREALAGRLHRAARNYTENVVLFVAAVVLLRSVSSPHPIGHWGVALWLVGRAAYLPAYGMGVRWGRTVCWQVAMVGLVLMVIAAFL